MGFLSCCRSSEDDMTPPRVLMIDPMNGAIDVSIMPAISVAFSKDMNFSTINVALIDIVTNRTVPCTLYRDDSMNITVVPKYELYPWSEYLFVVKEDCADIYGNWMMQSYTSKFRTGNYKKL